jgi:acyl-CoA synthetase (AMP-forming)/AMP-acid ligase II/acyl carrier protein
MEVITNYLRHYAEKNPARKVYVYLEDGENESASLTFDELLRAVETLSSDLTNRTQAGDKALLLYDTVMPFIIAFLACQHAGVTAVPMFFPKGKRHFERLELVLRDAACKLVLCETEHQMKVVEGFSRIGFTDMPVLGTSANVPPLPSASATIGRLNDLSFIQYTSGSTGDPKGVMVTHKNLLHNQSLIRNVFGCNEDTVILSWLPFYHDMGLVGNLLHAVYSGCTAILLSPYSFMQNPALWFKAISRYKVTHSGGPNFAYDLCADKIKPEEYHFDLSSWKIAYNGSEPVSKTTIEKFITKFAGCGFAAEAMFPCYGLAEATLLVSGSPYRPSENATVHSGHVAEGIEVSIINPDNQLPCAPGEPGEICLYGDSITEGYWGKDNKSFFIEHNGRAYLKTGDIGMLDNGQLTITGRIKEMIILNGQNHFPYDIERVVFKGVEAVEPNGVIVFDVTAPESGIVIVAEVKREWVQRTDLDLVLQQIALEVVNTQALTPIDVVLVKPRQLPRTSSGKLQRLKCKTQYIEKQIDVLISLRQQQGETLQRPYANPVFLEQVRNGAYTDGVHHYLRALIASKIGFTVPDKANLQEIELTEMGIDSIKAMEIINAVNKDLSINLVASNVFQENRYTTLVERIENLLWLKSQTSGEEIVI